VYDSCSRGLRLICRSGLVVSQTCLDAAANRVQELLINALRSNWCLDVRGRNWKRPETEENIYEGAYLKEIESQNWLSIT
jgi:hypothetical protein